jgi:hypothetical protein
MDAQIETLDEQTEKEIEVALGELRSIQFSDNTHTQAVEAREEVEIIIRALAKRLTQRACEWHLDDDEAGAWESACGELWCFGDGDPKDNGMQYCPFCGCHLTQRVPDASPSSSQADEL